MTALPTVHNLVERQSTCCWRACARVDAAGALRFFARREGKRGRTKERKSCRDFCIRFMGGIPTKRYSTRLLRVR